VDRRDEDTRTGQRDAESFNSTISPAERIGRYLVLSKIGEGGMGQVYSAYDPTLDRRVALKLLRPEGPASERNRLLREAKALARISHPNVLTIHEVEQIGAQVVMTMEFVPGGTLKTWLRINPADAERESRLVEALELLVQAGHGLCAAHARGLVHRDFKPSNVLVGQDGRVRVADFGLARPSAALTATNEELEDFELESNGVAVDVRVTRTGSVAGTPAYMAPEQWADRKLDARADQFSFCVVAWELLSGARPFAGKDLSELSAAIKAGPAQRPSDTMSADLLATLVKGMTFRASSRNKGLEVVVHTLEAELARLRGGVASKGRGGWKLLGIVGLCAAGYFGGAELNNRWISHSCLENAENSVAESWNDEARDALRAGILGSGQLHAADVADALTVWLDVRAGSIVAARVEACLNDEKGKWSPADSSRSHYCLDTAQIALESNVAMFARGRPGALARALEVAEDVPSVSCTAADDLIGLPSAPPRERLADANEVRRMVAEVAELLFEDALEEAAAVAQQAVAKAEDTGDRAAVAEARASLSAVHRRRGRPQKAFEVGTTAYMDAVAAGSWRNAHMTAGTLVLAAGSDLRDLEAAETWNRWGLVALSHLPDRQGLLLAQQQVRLAKAYMSVAGFTGSEAQAGRAQELYEEALATQESVFGDAYPQNGAILDGLARSYSLRGEHEAARSSFRRALALQSGSSKARTLAAFARMELKWGNVDDADRYFDRAIQISRNSLGNSHPDTLRILSGSAWVHWLRGRKEEALRVRREAYETSVAHLGPRSVDTNVLRLDYGESLVSVGRAADAKPLLVEALEIADARLEDDSPERIVFLQALASAVDATFDTAGAEALLGEAVELAEANHLPLGELARLQASVYNKQGKHSEACQVTRKLLAEVERERSGTEEHAATLLNLAILESAAEESMSALEHAVAGRQVLVQMQGPDSSFALAAGIVLGQIQRDLGDYAASLGTLEPTLAGLESSPQGDLERINEAKAQLALSLYEAPKGAGRDRGRAMRLMGEVIDYYEGLEHGSYVLSFVPVWAEGLRSNRLKNAP
jgi:serine/threonine protein kinase